MNTYRKDPDGDANFEATLQNRRELFALQRQAERDVERECARCHEPESECTCDEFMMGL